LNPSIRIVYVIFRVSKILAFSRNKQKWTLFFYRCTVHSDIHTVHSPTDARLLKL